AYLLELININNYIFVDWGPHGKFLVNCLDDVNATVCNYAVNPVWNCSQDGHTTTHQQDGLMAWHDGALPHRGLMCFFPKNTGGPEQWNLWKLPAATSGMTYWKENFFGTLCSMSNYHFESNSTVYVRACVRLPYVLAVGSIVINGSDSSLTGYECHLYTWLNRSVLFNHPSESILMLSARMHLWLPGNLTRPWEESPCVGVMYHLDRPYLLQFRLMIMFPDGTRTLNNYCSNKFIQRRNLKEGGELQQAVQCLEVMLHCDWNVTTYCVTPVKSNDTKYQWNSIKYHLNGPSGNMSLDMQALEKQILDHFSKRFACCFL
ncbi:Endogenous retrovirus group K member 18 Env polyprotein, partial [Galemys pyrenaicus]